MKIDDVALALSLISLAVAIAALVVNVLAR